MENGTSSLIVLKELAGNPPPELNAIQKFLEPHVDLLTNVWIFLWIVTAGAVLLILLHEYKRSKDS